MFRNSGGNDRVDGAVSFLVASLIGATFIIAVALVAGCIDDIELRKGKKGGAYTQVICL
jgi:hypothetical protein